MVRKRNKNPSAATACGGVPGDVGISGGASASGLAPHQALLNAELRNTVGEMKDERAQDHLHDKQSVPDSQDKKKWCEYDLAE